MRLVIIANPAAGGGRPFRQIQELARQWGSGRTTLSGGPQAEARYRHYQQSYQHYQQWNVTVLPTRAPGHAGELARELTRQSCDRLAVCGGDGTINEVVSALPLPPPFPVAILPGGTANVLARELRLPLNLARALDIALTGGSRLVDLGVMRAERNRRFTFVAGIGFDAWAVYKARPALKARIGIASYAAAVAECLLGYKFPRFTVSSGGNAYDATSCLVCNARSYGGGLSFCPDADMSDGLLDVLLIEGRRRVALLGFLLSAWIKPGMTASWMRRLRTRELRIDKSCGSPAGESPGALVEVDGELAGSLPAAFSLTEKALPLIVPA